MKKKFNPSKRNEEWEDQDLSWVEKTIREAGIKFAERQDKEIMIILMSLIRKRLREDPQMGKKLRALLRWEEYIEEIKGL